MLDRKAAQRLAEIAQDASDLYAVDERLTEEHSFGWVFYFLPNPDCGQDISGWFELSPFIVDRNGSVHCMGTREPPEEVIERYAQTGSVDEDP